MKQIKKHSIGFNTVSSTNGIINARGVKSKPNDIQVFGYTHEVGSGEKSPDNPYQLVSLDSGNVNLCKDWNYTSDLFTIYRNKITVQKTNNDTLYKISAKKEFTYSENKLYIYLKYEGFFTDGAKTPGFSIRLYDAQLEQLYRGVISYNKFNSCVEFDLSNIDTNSITYYSFTIENLTTDGTADYNFTIDVLMCENYISSYFEDEHSIVLSNGDTTIQVPVPIALNSVEGVSDYIFKDTDGIWKLMQNNKRYEFTGDEQFTLYNAVIFYNTNFLGYKITDNLICKSNHYKGVENKVNAGEMISSSANFSICFRNYEYNHGTLYIKDNRFSTAEEFVSFLAEQYENGTPLTIIYQLETPIVHTLSDYAQQLLNSFTLQNNNKIRVEGYPDLKISGYIQK